MALVAVYVFSQPNSCITMVIMSKINGLVAPSNRILALGCALLLIITPVSFADYEAGVNAAFNGDFETALHEFTIAAEEGLDLAQYNLGILYFTGQGVEKDYEPRPSAGPRRRHFRGMLLHSLISAACITPVMV